MARDSAWWPLEQREGQPERGFARLPDGSEYRVNWNPNNVTSKPAPFRVYRLDNPCFGDRGRVANCDTLLEVRCLLLALAYPEGNTPTS